MAVTTEIKVELLYSAVLSDTTKFRVPPPFAILFTDDTVHIDNFSNRNLYVDNSVSLNASITNDEGELLNTSYYAATESTHIRLTYGTRKIIGQITDVEYINDNNTLIYYAVDPFTSSIESGTINDMWGLCERTHINYSDYMSYVNLLPEPFTVTDTVRASEAVTSSINAAVNAFEGTEPSDTLVQFKAVMTISKKCAEYLNVTNPFTEVSANFPQELRTVNNFNFTGADTTQHSGGYYRGIPVVCEGPAVAKLVIQRLLGGCGFRTILPPGGYDSDGQIRRAYLTPDNAGAGNAYSVAENTNEIDMESISFITEQDIYNIYLLPDNFAHNHPNQYYVTGLHAFGLHTLNTITGMGSEPNRNSKVMTYPYHYYKAVTANGDTIDLYPQVYNVRDGVWAGSPALRLDMRYIGGDTPRLMGRMKLALSQDDPYSQDSISEWFTIRNYPSITISINDSYNPQIQKDIVQTQSLQAAHINSVINSQISNPFKTAFRDGYTYNKDRGALAEGLAIVGGAAGSLIRGGINAINNTGLFPGKPGTGDFTGSQENIDTLASARSMNASNIISPQTSYVQGNDFISQLFCPAFGIYAAGAANAEAYSFCRYLDEFGSATNCILRPLETVIGSPDSNIWAGLAGVVTNDEGLTFFQFTNMHVYGDMPVPWRESIKNLFESGVYIFNYTSENRTTKRQIKLGDMMLEKIDVQPQPVTELNIPVIQKTAIYQEGNLESQNEKLLEDIIKQMHSQPEREVMVSWEPERPENFEVINNVYTPKQMASVKRPISNNN